MILTITLNPLLDKTLNFDSLHLNRVNRAVSAELLAGGKGVNVSRQLNYLGIDNFATGFAGGDTGKKLRTLMSGEGIKHNFIQIKNESREGITVCCGESITSFFDPDPVVSMKEVEEFVLKSKKMISNSEMVIFSGSLPRVDNNSDSLEIIKDLLKFINDNDKIALIDIYSKNFPVLFESPPLAVHLNKSEAEKSFGYLFNDYEKDILDLLKYLYSNGIKIAFFTDGEKPVYAINHGFIYKAIPPEVKTINPTGSGDAFMAGFIYAFHNNMPFVDSLKISVALGSLNAARFSICNVSKDEIDQIFDLINVEKLN